MGLPWRVDVRVVYVGFLLNGYQTKRGASLGNVTLGLVDLTVTKVWSRMWSSSRGNLGSCL